MLFSIVVPCYNEAGNLEELAEEFDRVAASGDPLEVIFVNNGSTDNSAQMMERLKQTHSFLRVVTVKKNQGYGFGILRGLGAAKGSYLGWIHGDLQFRPAEVKTAMDRLRTEGYPRDVLVKGLRRHRPAADRLFTWGMGCFETILMGQKLWDINAQPVLFPRELYESWRNPPRDFSLDLYLYLSAAAGGYRIWRFPVEQQRRASGISSWNQGLRSRVRLVKRVAGYSLALKREQFPRETTRRVPGVLFSLAFLLPATGHYLSLLLGGGYFDGNQLLILAALPGVLCVFFLKALRIYFLLMYHKIPAGEFADAYLLTAYVNLLIPFKAGEIYRIYRYSKATGSCVFSLLAVLVDRLFDSVPLCLLLLLGCIQKNTAPSLLLLLTALFIALFGTAYLIFPSAYRLVNHFLIVQSASRRGLRLLAWMEGANRVYRELKKLLEGKTAILLLLSLLAWGMELALAGVNKSSGGTSWYDTVYAYTNASLTGQGERALAYFTISGAAVCVTLTAWIKVRSARSGKERAYGSETSGRL